MANLGQRASIAPGDTTVIDSAAQIPLGTHMFDPNGNEYIYLQGVASTVAGSAVNFKQDGTTALTVADAVGPVAVAMAATVANKFGWYQIYGSATVKSGTVAAGAAAYLTSTAGQIDDAVVSGDLIAGMFTRSSDSGGFATCQLSYPFSTNTLS